MDASVEHIPTLIILTMFYQIKHHKNIKDK
jgi:hypothetical protein